MTPRAALYARQSRNKAKSIEDQLVECREDAQESDYLVTAEWTDGRSASRYARNKRESWPLVLAAIERREVDVLILWEASRGDRTLTTWSAFLDLCRENDVKIRVVNDQREYDLSIDSDWRTLATSGVDAAHESGKLSKRISRGVASAARDGRPPAGPCPFGYRRSYDPATGALAGQEVDEERSAIVQEIIKRVGTNEPVSAITRDLNERGVTPPGGGSTWYRQRVRELAMSPVYVGKRAHRPGRGTTHEGQRAVHGAQWEALVTEAEHYAAVRILDDPARAKYATRPGRQKHLLTYLATCSVCDDGLRGRLDAYNCANGHVESKRAAVDEYVLENLITYLSRDDVYQRLRQQGASLDREVIAARDEIAALNQRLEKWRQSAARDETTPESLAAIEATISKDIAAAERREARASLPPALRNILGEGHDVRARIGDAPLAAKRTVLSTLFTISLLPSGHRVVPVDERVRMVPKQAIAR